jgi:hypothetical protein
MIDQRVHSVMGAYEGIVCGQRADITGSGDTGANGMSLIMCTV